MTDILIISKGKTSKTKMFIGPFGRKCNDADNELRSLSGEYFMMRLLTANMFDSLVEDCCQLLDR